MSLPVTYLFVPGDRPDRFAKALAAGADRAILDLEDAVKPDAKAAAREALRTADLDWARVVVRINDAASPYWEEDLAAVAATPAAAVMVPKAERAQDLTAVRAAVGREIDILPQIETVRGLDAIGDLLAVPGVRRAVFGHLDFALDLGAAPDWEALLTVRSTLVLQSRLAGRAAPVESVSPDISDEDRLRREAEAARRLGFGAKLLIHPRQVAPVARIFAPTAEEVAWAERVVAAVSATTAGAVTVDGRMVDKPVEDAARRILARAGGSDEGTHA